MDGVRRNASNRRNSAQPGRNLPAVNAQEVAAEVLNLDGSVALDREEFPRPGTTAESLANLNPSFPAVADYRPADSQPQKIKKGAETMTLSLVRNPDIVAGIAARDPAPFTVGFAAETNDVLDYARGKLAAKDLDLIVANDVSDTTIGFNSEENAVTLVWRDGEQVLPQASKGTVARQIIDRIAAMTGESSTE